MTYGAFTPHDVASFERSDASSKPIAPTTLCAVALAVTTALGLVILYAHPAATPSTIDAPAVAAVTALATPAPVVTRDVKRPAAIPPLRRYAAMLDLDFVSGHVPVTFVRSAPLRSSFEPLRQPVAPIDGQIRLATAEPSVIESSVAAPPVAAPPAPVVSAPVVSDLGQDVPLPAPRPAGLLPGNDNASAPRTSSPHAGTDARIAPLPQPAAPTAQPERPGFFEKMFGRSQPPGSVLAYAAPDDGGLGNVVKDGMGRPLPYDRWTAVYDIAAHTVYLPDGTRLEAHSGLGNRLDDPNSVTERMRGATPPNVYELTPREQIFHGVRALRLTPTGGTTFGRGGLLAHTFMLGPRGDSNGCVVFRNYKAFLEAYDSGAIRRLAVVTRLN